MEQEMYTNNSDRWKIGQKINEIHGKRFQVEASSLNEIKEKNGGGERGAMQMAEKEGLHTHLIHKFTNMVKKI